MPDCGKKSTENLRERGRLPPDAKGCLSLAVRGENGTSAIGWRLEGLTGWGEWNATTDTWIGVSPRKFLSPFFVHHLNILSFNHLHPPPIFSAMSIPNFFFSPKLSLTQTTLPRTFAQEIRKMNKTLTIPLLPVSTFEKFPAVGYLSLHAGHFRSAVLSEKGYLNALRLAYSSAGSRANHWFTLNLFGSALAYTLGVGKTMATKGGLILYVMLNEVSFDSVKDYIAGERLVWGQNLKKGILVSGSDFRVAFANFKVIPAGNIPGTALWMSIAVHFNIFAIAALIRKPISCGSIAAKEVDKVLKLVSGRELSNFAKVLYSEMDSDMKEHVTAVGSSLNHVFGGYEISAADFNALATSDVFEPNYDTEIDTIDAAESTIKDAPKNGYTSIEGYLAQLNAMIRNMKDWDEKDFWNEMTFIYAKAKLGEDVKTMKQILEMKGKAMGLLEQQPQGNTNNIVVLTNEAISALSRMGLAKRKEIG